ncbi:MAG TPA: membrane dipeptidase [Terriglobales bacterium]|nr:membrane dipeptidase [Terriglobales bacterium]
MNRREFSFLVAGTVVSGALPKCSAIVASAQAVADTSEISPQTDELYRRWLVLDCNSAPPLEEKLPLPQSDLDMARNSGVSVVKMTLGGFGSDFAGTVDEIAWVQRLIEMHPDYFLQVRLAEDMERAHREKKMGIIFSFEGVSMLEDKVDRIEVFRNLGVRVMQLSYNGKSVFGAGVLEPNAGGLTTLGQDAVKKMNELGVAIDLSHSNPKTTTDAMAASRKPVIISHAGCSAIHAHPRNKTDEQIRTLADKGGVMGIYDLPFLAPSPRQPTVEDYMAHVERALKVGGEDHVGVGSDAGVSPFDTSPKALAEFKKSQEARVKAGAAAPEEDRYPYVVGLNTPLRLEVITDQLLKRGYSPRVTEKVVGANFARVLREIWS